MLTLTLPRRECEGVDDDGPESRGPRRTWPSDLRRSGVLRIDSWGTIESPKSHFFFYWSPVRIARTTFSRSAILPIRTRCETKLFFFDYLLITLDFAVHLLELHHRKVSASEGETLFPRKPEGKARNYSNALSWRIFPAVPIYSAQ